MYIYMYIYIYICIILLIKRKLKNLDFIDIEQHIYFIIDIKCQHVSLCHLCNKYVVQCLYNRDFSVCAL